MTVPAPLRSEIVLDGRRLETAWWDAADPASKGEDQASRPAIVLLHEGLGCIDLWRDIPAILATWTRLPVFAYSRFGYGRSDSAPLPWPVTYMHDEARLVLPRVLRAVGIGRHVLVGHSDGGSIAVINAGSVQDPGLAAIITIAAHFFVEPVNVAAIQRTRLSYLSSDLRARLARYHSNVDIAFHGWSNTWLDPRFRDFDITGYLPAIRVPILGLQGQDDPYGTDAQLAALTDHARVRAETRLIANARHAPHLEARQETLAAITGFILELPQ
jgi:pimeloyl-ACP methyl ester carboxylesterase